MQTILICLLPLLRGFGSLGFFGTTELEIEGMRYICSKVVQISVPSSPGFSSPSSTYDRACQPFWQVQTRGGMNTWVEHIYEVAYTNEPMLGFKFLLWYLVIINQSKACAPSTTILRSETKCHNAGFIGLIKGGELFGKFDLGNIRSWWMKDIDNELAPCKESVCDEFACAHCDGCVTIGLKARMNLMGEEPSPKGAAHSPYWKP